MHQKPLSVYALPTVLSCVLVTGCLARFLYSGDGKMTDHGPLAAHNRYILDLGQIDLTKREQRSFRIANLPNETFVCGIELTAPAGGHFDWDTNEINASASIIIVSQSGGVVARAEGPLRRWRWSTQIPDDSRAFLYNGSGIRAPPGSDSYFVPVRGESYRVELTVNEPELSQSGITARLELKGGGWK